MGHMIDPEGDRGIDCKCAFFMALSERDQLDQVRFRQAAQEGILIEGFFNSLCGPCVRRYLIDIAIENEIKKMIDPCVEVEVESG